MNPRARAGSSFWLAPSVVLLTALFVVGYLRGPTLDASVFMQISEQLRSGDMLYRDVFDHKPPGIFLAEAGVGTILPFIDPWIRAWSISWIAGILTLAILFRLVSRAFTYRTASIAVLGVAPILAGFPFAVGGGHTESLAVVAIAASFALAVQGEPRHRTAIGIGVLVAAGLGTSLQVLAGALATVIVFQLRWKTPVAMAGVALGGTAVALPILVWIARSGGWDGALEQLIEYNAAYAEQNRGFLGAAPILLMLAALTAAPALIAGALGLFRIPEPSEDGSLGAGAALWIGLWVIYLIWQGRLVGHHVIAVVPAIAVLGALTINGLFLSGDSHRSIERASGALIATIVALGVSGFAIPGQPKLPGDVAMTVPIIRSALADPGSSTLFVWGNEPSLYVMTGIDPASRFVYMLPLTLPGYASPRVVEAILGEWVGRPPDVIIDASRNPEGVNAPPLLEIRATSVPDDLDPLRAFVADGYLVHQRIGDWIVYVRATTP